MRELKKITDVHHFTEEQLSKKVEDIRKYWIETINRLNYKTPFNLAITLNFNNTNLSYPLSIQSVQNRLDEWWKLFCSYHLGRNTRNYKQMDYSIRLTQSPFLEQTNSLSSTYFSDGR